MASVRGHEVVAEGDLQDAFRVALDCMTDYRRQRFIAVAHGREPETVGIPKTMRQRALEELGELGILERPDSKSGHRLSDRVTCLLLNEFGIERVARANSLTDGGESFICPFLLSRTTIIGRD